MFYTSLFNLNDQKSNQKTEKDLQESRSYNSESNLASTSSNLNPFAANNDQTTNLLVLLQGFQMVASRSNVVLFAVGGIVNRIFLLILTP